MGNGTLGKKEKEQVENWAALYHQHERQKDAEVVKEAVKEGVRKGLDDYFLPLTKRVEKHDYLFVGIGLVLMIIVITLII